MISLPPASKRGKHQKKLKTKMHQPRKSRKPPYARRGVFIFGAAFCGLVIAVILYLSSPAVRQNSESPNIPSRTSVTNESDPKQDNPLFAARPSWSQNFAKQQSGVPDPSFWNVLVGPAINSNREAQYYTENYTNLRIENGALRLIATRGTYPDGYQYGSARLETEKKQTFLYGRIDVTAKLPRGTGTWPAVWLLPATDTYANKSPVSDQLRYRNGGEIDIVEAVGHQPDVVYGVAHTASSAAQNADGTGSFKSIAVPGSSANYNIYTLLWTPTSLTFEVNGAPYFTYSRQNGADYKTWPFDQPFFMIVNLAMGGTWGGQDTARFPGNGIDNTALPTSLDIRSIYYYSYTGPR